MVGVVAAILLSAGLLPPYFELWKRDGRVLGISKSLAWDLGGFPEWLANMIRLGVPLHRHARRVVLALCFGYMLLSKIAPSFITNI